MATPTMNLVCRSCGSKRLLRGARLIARGVFGLAQVILEVPANLGLRGRVRSPVAGHVCADCGLLDFHATDLLELKRAYASIGEPLGLGSRDADELEPGR
jgi:hypothetical protein